MHESIFGLENINMSLIYYPELLMYGQIVGGGTASVSHTISIWTGEGSVSESLAKGVRHRRVSTHLVNDLTRS